MPSYDFVCQDCRDPYEVRISMSDYSAGEGRQCPGCGSTNVERTFTGVNVIAGSRSGGGAGQSMSSALGGACGPSGFT